MTREHQRPVLQPSAAFDGIIGSDDPEAAHRLAQETSWALLHRVRDGADPEIVQRVVDVAAGDGINDIAELWARESAHSLAGVLWRLYLLRRITLADPVGTADLFARGSRRIGTIDPIVVGAVEPATPETIAELCDRILRGAFVGDLGVTLDRAAAYSRVMAAGAAELADDRDPHDEAHGSQLTTRALRYAMIARELDGAARRWRDGTLG
ncbi:hypothetical protein ACFSWE_15960 [Leucobacter albus]|uniref:DNA-directed RNA polymerase subunit beta n=1 Tax=Leucobacter albus TaxID=272210 RepID=A0ABW3TMQ0_9MICO